MGSSRGQSRTRRKPLGCPHAGAERGADLFPEIGPEIARYEYQYPGRPPILLIFFKVDRFLGEPRNLVFERIAWALPRELPSYDFLEGDVEFVCTLAR